MSVISPEYAALNVELHQSKPGYGSGGAQHAWVVLALAARLQTQSVLDYGAGKGGLAKALPFLIHEYDPAITEKCAPPEPADLIVCTDVLEHVEPARLLAVLADLRRVTGRAAFFVIHIGPARKCLPDGRNAHLIQQDVAWWCTAVGEYFTITGLMEMPVMTVVEDSGRLTLVPTGVALHLVGVPRYIGVPKYEAREL